MERLAPFTSGGSVLVVSDARLCLPAAGLEDGVSVICGTGAVALGVLGERQAHVGGWGFLLGDEGSGYWITREALRTVLGRADHAQPVGALGALLFSKTDATDVRGLLQRFYDDPHPDRWASYAPSVLDADDPAVDGICASAARALAVLAGATLDRMGDPPGLPVLFAGGLIEARIDLFVTTRALLAAARPGHSVHRLAQEPIVGAVRLAEAAALAHH